MRYTIYTRDENAVAPSKRIRVVTSRWPTERRTARILWEQSAWPLLAARERFDLLHGMAFATPLLGSIPSIVTVYDLSFLHFPEKFPRLQRIYLRNQTAQSIRKAHRIITISESGRQDLQHFFGVSSEKIDVVLPGVDRQFRPLPDDEIARFRTERSLPENVILHVGTLQPRKNIPTLLKAFSMLRRDDVHLVLAGAKGWLYDEIFEQIKVLRLEDRVHVLGYVADEALPYWYNAAKVLVFPSLYEGFGMPVLEAMACGTPVVASCSSSIPEAGGEAAYYFDPQDAESLTEQLHTILDNSGLAAQLRQLGLAQARSFSWERAGIETSRVYSRVLLDR